MLRISTVLLWFEAIEYIRLPTCQSASIEAMDLTTDPCDNFFLYSCGSWLKRNPIPPNKVRWSQFDVLRDQVTSSVREILERPHDPNDPKPLNDAKTMYKACLDTTRIQSKGLKPLMDFLSAYGGWPITMDNSWTPASFDWRSVTSAIRKQLRISYLISVYNDLDNLDTKKNAIHIDQGSLTLPYSAYMNAKTSERIMEAYRSYIVGSAKFVRDYLKTTASDAQIEVDARNLIRFETELAKIISPAEKRRNNTRMYNPMLLSELQKWTDGFDFKTSQASIDWARYLNSIYGPVGVSISINERVIVLETEYVRKLFALLEVTPNRIIANYIHWRLFRFLSPSTSSAMNSLALNFSRVLYGNPPSESRVNLCASEVNSVLGFAISSKYIKEYFDERSKPQVHQMIKNIKSVFKESLNMIDWMDNSTKRVAQEKVDAMIELVGYPDWIKDKAALESHYSGFEVSSTDHFQNLRNIDSLLTRQELRSLRGTPDRRRWPTFPTVVNAFYSPKYNSIIFPAGIIQTPFFSLDGRTSAMNYGGLGTVIGHELIHGFDDRGRQSDKSGNSVAWWSESTVYSFLNRAQCFTQLYENQEVLDGMRLNGVVTQGENIADNGGIHQAYRAYRRFANGYAPEIKPPGLEQLTQDQIFFISYAQTYCGTETPEKLANQIENDPHSPGRYRVIVPLANSEDFVREFQCPSGSMMNTLEKCTLWR